MLDMNEGWKDIDADNEEKIINNVRFVRPKKSITLSLSCQICDKSQDNCLLDSPVSCILDNDEVYKKGCLLAETNYQTSYGKVEPIKCYINIKWII